MKNMRNGCLLLLLISLAACGSVGHKPAVKKTHQPDWILNPPATAQYLYGVGSADSYGDDVAALTRARELALADLVQQIEVSIAARSHTRQEHQSSSNGESTFSQRVEQVIDTRVPKLTFSYVSTEESFKDEAARRLYALVSLDLQQESAALRKRILEKDDQLQQQLEGLDFSSKAKIADLRRISATLVIFREREKLQQRLLTLQPGAFAIPQDSTLVDLEHRLLERIATLSVVIEPAGEANRELQAAIAEQLTKRGLTVVERGGDLTIIYDLALQLLEQDNTFFGLTKGSARLQDRSGVTIKTIKANSKGVSGNRQLARNRAVDKLGQALGNGIVDALF